MPFLLELVIKHVLTKRLVPAVQQDLQLLS